MAGEALAAAAAVDEARLWGRQMALAEIGATAAGGVNRAALSPEDRAARKLMIAWARERGFAVATDGIANLYIRRPGRRNDAAPVVTGSHLDSQPRGGKFDGAYGVVGGFEALEAIDRAGAETERPIEVAAWTNEEGGRFQPGAMGSAVFAGALRLEDQRGIVDRDGIALGAALAETLASTPALPRRDFARPFAAYAEAHAGTTPLAGRRDALKAALAMVGALEELMADPADTVRFTVGRFECEPGAPSTVPSRVLFTIDFRHPDPAVIERLRPAIAPLCLAHARGCAVSVRPTIENPPVRFDPTVIETVERYADALGHSCMRLPSGAGHDAGHIAALCPTGMIFVPCAGGLSHNEAESATPADLAAGARTLAACLVDLANREAP